MELKQVIHYYIGCECLQQPYLPASNKQVKGKLVGILPENAAIVQFMPLVPESQWTMDYGIEHIRPILRKLEDMTEEEAKRFLAVVPDDRGGKEYLSHNRDGVFWRGAGVSSSHMCFDYATPEQFHYLISHGFDLFGLIDSGAAIDATTLNHPNPDEQL